MVAPLSVTVKVMQNVSVFVLLFDVPNLNLILPVVLFHVTVMPSFAVPFV